MEYADRLRREAERRQRIIETPYDVQLHEAQHMRDKINMLLALMRSEISDYHRKYGNINALSDQLQDAENGMDDAMTDIISDVQRKIEKYMEENQ